MLTSATDQDGPSIVDLAVAAGLFSRAEAGLLTELVPAHDGAVCLVDNAGDGEGLAGVLLYRPEEAADRAWDLTMIAVRPDLQRGGRGTALMRHVEEDLRARGQRLLVVRTSGTSRYDRTRAFYRRLGYLEQSRVRDYWADGDDLVLFTIRL